MRHLGDICKINGAEIEPVDVITAKVYMYTFPDGKIYIGMTTKSLEERRNGGYQHNRALQNAMRSCGWKAIKKTILAEFENIEDAFEEEKKQIELHDATNPAKGYNISSGGKSTFAGRKHSEEHKAYMSNLYKGKVFTAEHIQNLKTAHAKERKAVESMDAQGNVLKRYESLSEAADDIGGYRTNVSRACNTKREYKGFFWEFAEGGEVR